TLQLLLRRLRSGAIPSQAYWVQLANMPPLRPGTSVVAPSVPALSDYALAAIGADGRVYATFASLMSAGPWLPIGGDAGLVAPSGAHLTAATHPNGREAFLFMIGSAGQVMYTRSEMGNPWTAWAPVGDLQVPTATRIATAGIGRDAVLQIFV